MICICFTHRKQVAFPHPLCFAFPFARKGVLLQYLVHTSEYDGGLGGLSLLNAVSKRERAVQQLWEIEHQMEGNPITMNPTGLHAQVGGMQC
jgi:hypothetical protein